MRLGHATTPEYLHRVGLRDLSVDVIWAPGGTLTMPLLGAGSLGEKYTNFMTRFGERSSSLQTRRYYLPAYPKPGNLESWFSNSLYHWTVIFFEESMRRVVILWGFCYLGFYFILFWYFSFFFLEIYHNVNILAGEMGFFPIPINKIRIYYRCIFISIKQRTTTPLICYF